MSSQDRTPDVDAAGSSEPDLVAVRDTALSVDEVMQAVRDPHAGAVVVFVGAVRDHDDDRAVARLSYVAHPSAEVRAREVASAVRGGWDIRGLAVAHRVGDLEVGDLAIVAAVSSAHRAEAFGACQALVDAYKAGVPIWKHQVFVDGTQEWVGTP